MSQKTLGVLLNIADAAARFRVSEAQIKKWYQSGELRCHRAVGQKIVRFTEEDLAEFASRKFKQSSVKATD